MFCEFGFEIPIPGLMFISNFHIGSVCWNALHHRTMIEGNDTTEGDIHQWNVWDLEQKPYQEYKKLAGRFVSEFGMHGFPVQRTVDYFTHCGKKGDLHAQSRLIDCHK